MLFGTHSFVWGTCRFLAFFLDGSLKAVVILDLYVTIMATFWHFLTFSFNSFILLFFTSSCTNQWRSSISVYKPYTTHNSSTRSDEGLTFKMSAFKALYSGQFTLSMQLIKPNYFVILPLTQHHSFLKETFPYYSPFYRGHFPLSQWLTVVERFTCISHLQWNFFLHPLL